MRQCRGRKDEYISCDNEAFACQPHTCACFHLDRSGREEWR